jgi:hypothetical protein
VTETFSNATPPNPTGGLFLPGTYNLTSLTAYVATDAALPTAGPVRRQVFVLSNVTEDTLTLDQAISSGTVVNRSHGTVAFAATNATYTPTCPVTDGGNGDATNHFTVTSSGFTLFEMDENNVTVVSVFAKVP